MKRRNCPFCGTESAALLPDETAAWHSLGSRRLASMDAFSLCAGLGPIVEPYVLAYPHEHFTAVSEFDAALRRNLLDALDLCLASGLFPSGRLSVFEHGGPVAHGPNACLEHCHLHIVDGAYDLQRSLLGGHFQPRPAVISAESALAAIPGYLLAGSYDGHRTITGCYVENPDCGSQFFRQLLAAQVGSADWNWRLAPKPERAQQLCAQWPQAPGVSESGAPW